MKKQSLSKNYIFQFLYQGLILLIPLVLAPYLTRTLGGAALGTYSYVHSIAYYFVIAANLGIEIHGKRTVSQCAHDEEKLRRVFWSLFAVHVGFSLLAVGLYAVFFSVFAAQDRAIYIIESIYVASALFDITWLFYGLENITSVVIKNAAVKLAECVGVFLLVKGPQDLWKYTLITAGSVCLGQIVMVPQAMRAIRPVRPDREEMRRHLKPLFVFSVSIIAISLYTVFDKTLLGLMTTKENVAFYEYSDKIVNIPKSFVRITGNVMLPRACKLAVQGKRAEQEKYIGYSFFLTALIGLGAMFGLFAVADLFALVFYGEGFRACGNIIRALSPLAYIIGVGSVLRSQCMIPYEMDRQFNLCIVLNAVVNLVLSIALIPALGIYGAVIGTLSAELFGLGYQLWICRRHMDYRSLVNTFVPFMAIGALMFGAVRLVARVTPATAGGLLTQIAAGVAVYGALTGAYVLLFRRDLKDALLGIRKRNND